MRLNRFIYGMLMLLIVSGGWLITDCLRDKAIHEIMESNQAKLSLQQARFKDTASYIQRSAKTLSGSPWILPALISGTVENIARANDALDRYCRNLNAAVTYLMDENGTAIAASNRNEPDSFVGKSYAFRPYFTRAISGTPDRYLAVGATSEKRGFYASHPVQNASGGIVGVVVVKQDINWLNEKIKTPEITFLIDPNGIIFLSNRPQLDLRCLWPVREEVQTALRKSRQFGSIIFNSLLPRQIENGDRVALDGTEYLVSRKNIDIDGWSLMILAPMQQVATHTALGVVLTIWLCTIVAIPMILNLRSQRYTERIKASENRFRGLFNAITSGVAVYRAVEGGKDFILTDINPSGERVSQVDKSEIIGRQLTAVFPGAGDLGLLDVFRQVWQTGEHRKIPASHYQDGRISMWVENTVYKLDTGEIVSVYDDVSERKRMEAEILALSITDPLTGLQNRRGFLSLTDQQLKLSERHRHRMLLFFADLDGLKWINDTMGHKEGDKAIVEAATVWKGTFRSSDIVARLGGDEFAALAIDTNDKSCQFFTDRLAELLEARNRMPSRRYRLSISMGCSLYDPEAPASIDELMVEADRLMYAQKKQRKAEGGSG